ncbi:MAG: hypothetical protein JW976_03200 [Syntrophaceae bacterium]|nr:hypothetical protein [Syntrophaceae bacterium]
MCIATEKNIYFEDKQYCTDSDNRLCGNKKTGEVCYVPTSYGCFTANTLIKTELDQNKKIGELKPGDLIQGYNLEEQKVEQVEILKVLKHEKQRYYSIYFKDNSVLKVTKDHPLYTANGYVKVKDLKVGDKVGKIKDQQLEFIETTKIKKSLFKKTVYNLEVDRHHNYFANEFLVHNKLDACDAAPNGVGIKLADECGECKVCSNDSCVPVPDGQDIDFLDFCSTEDCGKGYCDGSGECSYYTDFLQHNCSESFYCNEEGFCEEDPAYNAIILHNDEIMVRKSENLIIDTDPIFIERFLEPFLPAVIGTEEGNLTIKSDVTLGTGSYLIWGKDKKLILDGGNIILDGGAIVQAGEEIKSGLGEKSTLLLFRGYEEYAGLRACICSLKDQGNSFEKRIYGTLPVFAGQLGRGKCSDNDTLYSEDEQLMERVKDDYVNLTYENIEIMPNGERYNWKSKDNLRYKQEITVVDTVPDPINGNPIELENEGVSKKLVLADGFWRKATSDTEGRCNERMDIIYWYPDTEAGYWKCKRCVHDIWRWFILFGRGDWESCTDNWNVLPDSYDPLTICPDRHCPLYEMGWH